MPRTLGSLAVGAALALLAACGSGQGQRADLPRLSPSPTMGESAAATPSPSTDLPAYLAQPDEPAGQARTAASAKAYAAYALQLVQYSYAARDVPSLRAHIVDWTKCSSCVQDAKGTRKQLREGYAQIPDRMPKAGPVYVMDRSPGRYSLVTTFTMPRGKKVGDDGTVLDTLGSVPGSFEVQLAWSQPAKSWQIENYRVVLKAGS